MKSSHLHIPRWVATLAVVTALVCGGVFAIGLRNWSDHPVFGAAPLNITLARNDGPVSLGDFQNGFSSVLEAGSSRRRQYSQLEGREAS